jgi:hypothetical protein
MIFKLGAMPYGIVERSMTLFGEEVMPRIRRVLDDDAAAQRAVAAPALYGVGGSSEGRFAVAGNRQRRVRVQQARTIGLRTRLQGRAE